MTDNEIIKAFECKAGKYSGTGGKCFNCKYHYGNYICKSNEIFRDALDLINRQKAEIEKKDIEIDILIRKKEALKDEVSELRAEVERLKENNQKLYEEMAERQKEEVAIAKRMGKSEAIKEFWGKLRKSIKQSVEDAWHGDGNGIYDAECVLDDGDNLVKEMAGDDNA